MTGNKNPLPHDCGDEVDEAVSWYQKQTEDQDLNFLDELVRASV